MGEQRMVYQEILDGAIKSAPAGRTLGWEPLEFVPEERRARCRFQLREEFLNIAGFVQGGFLSAMLDATMGSAAATVLKTGDGAPTLEMKISFYRPAKVGALEGQGRVAHSAGGVLFLEAALTGPDGKTVASATSTARVITGLLKSPAQATA